MGGTFIHFDDVDTNQTIPERFRQQVQLYGDRVAITSSRLNMTYGELDRYSDRIASALLGRQLQNDRPIGILMGHAPQTIACLIGVLKAGAFYVPISPQLPSERLNQIIDQTNCQLMIADDGTIGNSPPTPRCDYHHVQTLYEEGEGDQELSNSKPTDLCFLMTTSGSTGNPKTVCRIHRNVLRNTRRFTNELCVTSEDKITLIAACNFAASVSDIFGTLLNGATLCMYDLREHSVTDLARWLIEQNVTVYHSVASVFRSMIHSKSSDQRFPQIRLVKLGGEPILDTDFHLFREHFESSSQFCVGYGTTETNIVCQRKYAASDDVECGVLPVGVPSRDVEVMILGEDGSVLPQGEVGRVQLRGDSFSVGYWDAPELTNAVFTPDPDDGERRFFLTADMGRIDDSGTLSLVGRAGTTAKIRGNRVEFGDVESALSKLPGIAQCVVSVWEKSNSDHRLIAHYTESKEGSPNRTKLVQSLKRSLPDHMIPSAFLKVTSFPLTSTGKIDRKSLPPPNRERPQLDNNYSPPRNETEAFLVGVWSDLLALDQVGVHDDFFELGGDSNLVVSLFSAVESRFEKKLPFATILKSNTIARLAEAITQDEHDDGIVSIMSLGKEGSLQPIYLMPSLGGELYYSKHLLERLDNVPVFGLQPSFSTEYETILQDFNATARAFADSIMEHTDGPYSLMGYSYGALLAFAVACSLVDSGRSVELLIAIDLGPGDRGRPNNLFRSLGKFLRIGANAPRWLVDELRDFSMGRLRKSAFRKLRRLYRFTLSRGAKGVAIEDRLDVADVPTQNVRFRKTAFESFRRYVPKHYSGRITVMRAAVDALLSGKHSDHGWSRFVDHVTVYRISGNHKTMIHPPHAEELAAILAQLADERSSRD